MTYRTIVADPPWSIGSIPGMPRVSEGGPGKGPMNGVKTKRRTEPPYVMMPLEEIKALPVASLAEPDAHLYLWTINRYLEDTYEVARAWGFRPAQILVWAKPPRGTFIGTYSSTTEFCLFCRRGTLPAKTRIDSTWFPWGRSNTHSRKPEAFFDMVERVSPGPYVELFSRRARLGWDYRWHDGDLVSAPTTADEEG